MSDDDTPLEAPPRCWEEVEVPGPPTRLVPGDVCREGLWTVVRDHDDGEVVRIWDAPNPGLIN